MPKPRKILVNSQIIKRFMVKEFGEISRHRIIDFVPNIIMSRPSEESILATWEEHFRSQRVPYVLTEREVDHHAYGIVMVRALWKEEFSGR